MLRRGILAAAILLAASDSALGRATQGRITQKGVLVNDYPPFSFVGDTNEVEGFKVDVANKLGMKLEIQTPA